MNDVLCKKIIDESTIVKRKKQFNERWKIIDTEDKKITKIRCLAVIKNIFNDTSIYIRDNYGNAYESMNFLCSDICMILGIQDYPNIYSTFEKKYLYKYINDLDFRYDKNYITFLFFLEIILNYNYQHIDNLELAKKLSEALQLSNAKVNIIKDGNEYYIIPTNTEFLDDSLVYDNLVWLNDYKEAKTHFLNAIRFERKEKYYRNIVDELRVSLELLLKKVFNNNKSLENQKNNIGSFFASNNISTNISNMYIKLLDLYMIFNNNNAKHDDKVNGIEIDYLIYLTGTFIRFILLIKEHEKIIK